MQDLSKQLLSNPSSVRKELDAVYDYLSEADTDTDGEVIFAFATNSLSNLDKALELYRAFLPRDLVFSGRGDDANRNAAQTYRDLAIEAGVPREFIVRELTSSTLLESVCESLSLFEEFQWSLKRIILVNSPHLQRRGWCLFKKHLPEVVGLQRQNSKAETGYGREDWFTHQKGIDAIFYEFFAMKEAAVMNVA